MSKTRLSIQPVWSGNDKKMSTGILDTAETLMSNIDELAEVLDNLKDKYDQEINGITNGLPESSVTVVINSPDSPTTPSTPDTPSTTASPSSSSTPNTPGTPSSQQSSAFNFPNGENMFRKLKTCLDSTRHLIGSLRREKDRLMKREISVECKLGEVEDYKTHVKQDLTSLNELVDLLTTKVCNLEVELCDEQENLESVKCERDRIEERLNRAENLCKELNGDNDKLREENKKLAKERTDVLLKLENKELRYENEMLIVENAKLKEMLREKTDSMEGDLGVGTISKTDSKVAMAFLPDLIEDRSNNNDPLLINEETVSVRL